MLNQAQVQALRSAVNKALGLPDMHALGHNFIDHFVVRQARVSHESYRESERLRTTYEGMRSWCDAYDYRYFRSGEVGEGKYRMTPKRYRVLIAFLEALQAVLRVELLYEGGDLPLPPE